MKRIIPTRNAKRASFRVGTLLALAWALFSYSHPVAFKATGDWAYPFFAAETLAAVLFLVRADSVSVTTAPLDWAPAISATFMPFLSAPATWEILPQAKLLLAVGISMQLAGLMSLNRSFGIGPARREIKTAGMYRPCDIRCIPPLEASPCH